MAGGLNLYGYANGDPINYSDPFGLYAETQDETGSEAEGSDCPDGYERIVHDDKAHCMNRKDNSDVRDDDFHKKAEADDRHVLRDARCEAATDHVLRGLTEDFLLGVAWATSPVAGATATGAYLISRSEHGGAQYVPAVGVGVRFAQQWKTCTGGGNE